MIVYPSVLIVGGVDPTSGAGITLDVRVAENLGVHGFLAATAVTAQNSSGVLSYESVSHEVFSSQLKSIVEEFSPKAIKVGLITEQYQLSEMEKIQSKLGCAIVWDPVLSSSSGSQLSEPELIKKGIRMLNSQICLFTPNFSEVEELTGIKIGSEDDLKNAGSMLLDQGIQSVLIKGGHSIVNSDDAIDYFCNADEAFWVSSKRITDAHEVRGTGCTLSTAISSLIAADYDPRDAIVLAKGMITENLKAMHIQGNMKFQGLSCLLYTSDAADD